MKAYLHYCDGRVVAVDVRQDAYPPTIQRVRYSAPFSAFSVERALRPTPWAARTFIIDIETSYEAGVDLYYEEGYAPQVPRNH
jgi:hypothetical protein